MSISVGSLESLLLNNRVFQFCLARRCRSSFANIMHIISGVSKGLCLLPTPTVWHLIRKLNNLWNAAATPGFKGCIHLISFLYDDKHDMWISILLLKEYYSILTTTVSSIIYKILEEFPWLSSGVFDESCFPITTFTYIRKVMHWVINDPLKTTWFITVGYFDIFHHWQIVFFQFCHSYDDLSSIGSSQFNLFLHNCRMICLPFNKKGTPNPPGS